MVLTNSTPAVGNLLSEIESDLSTPSRALIDDLATIDGDVIVLGAGGKVGPSVAAMAARAVADSNTDKTVYAVSRFSSQRIHDSLLEYGVVPVRADLTDDEALRSLPDAANVIYMAGNKFGTTGNEHHTWMMNSYLPGRVADRYRRSRIVAFSTLLVYPMASVTHGGSRETDPPEGHGEYAASCVGRERVLEHFSRKNGTPLVLFRLGYSIETRYGVLSEVAQAVESGTPIDLTMGHASVVWQRDVAEYALRALNLAAVPPRRLNITGPEIVSIRWLAERFGELLGRDPVFEGTESDTAYVMDGSSLQSKFGFPQTPLAQMIERVASWTLNGGPTIDKPTKFQQRNGSF